jgi:hypothetical protein
MLIHVLRGRTLRTALIGLLCALILPTSAHAGKAHTHGVAQLQLSIEGSRLELAFELPLDTLVGFERAPRNAGEREAARAALTRLREGSNLAKPDAAARCRVLGTDVQAPLLESKTPDAAAGAKSPEHADALVTLTFECEQIAQLGAVDLVLFDAFARLQRVEAAMVTPKGQGKATLRRAAKTLRLPR